MDADTPSPPLNQKADLLASSAARLSAAASAIPSGRDFHFFSNFPEFKDPAKDLAQKSESLLKILASSGNLWGRRTPSALPADPDDVYDWLVGLNDDLLERFAASLDEFKAVREKEEESGVRSVAVEMEENGFQLVSGKKKRGSARRSEREEADVADGASTGIKVATRDTKTTAARSRVPFHIPSIARPQDQYSILVNNSNQPFEHVWLERSEDGSRFVHPLEKLSVLDFVDRTVGGGEPVPPFPLASTPFTLVEEVKELKELAAKLRDVNEFAVDLEHNHYRSFQGLTCLMQISTRTEDFVIDTLKLRIHVGPYLREPFKDPSKRKVMHGADRDILWLQRDFGIYVCNLFDTGQASRVLQLERNSLEYLLHHYCGVNANKEYQNADWRLRPIPPEMLKYSREDTHYLLHIYDLMRMRLLSTSLNENDLLLEVYKRSAEICMQLYEKELLTDTSYFYIYGLHEADFDSKQLATAAGLYEWRDKVARNEDESTGYILPNKALLEIARQMPLSPSKLRQFTRSKHPFVERHLNTVIDIIKTSVENSYAFESIVEQLKRRRSEALSLQNTEANGCNNDVFPATEDAMVSTMDEGGVLDDDNDANTMLSEEVATPMDVVGDYTKSSIIEHVSDQVTSITTSYEEKKLHPISRSEIECSLSGSSETIDREKTRNGFAESSASAKKATSASVQISRKPTGSFGALLGNTSRRKFNPNKGGTAEQDKNEHKVLQIKSSVALPFHSFSGDEKHMALKYVNIEHPPQTETLGKYLNQPDEAFSSEDVIPLDADREKPQLPTENVKAGDSVKHREWFPPLSDNNVGDGSSPEESSKEGVPMSLPDLESSFQKCFQSINERRGSKQNERPSQDAEYNLQLKPFDYATARREMKFGEVREGKAKDENESISSPDFGDLRKGFALSRPDIGGERVKEFKNPRRRQAFPASGNRSSTYRN